MLCGLLILFLSSLHVADVTARDHPTCLDPPWNNLIAKSVVMSLEAARGVMQNGIPDLGIPPLDPMGPLPRIPFGIDTPAMWMEGEVNDTLLAGLADFVICSLNISMGLTQKMDMDFRLPDMVLSGKYSVEGLMAQLLPIFGQGTYRMEVVEAGFIAGAGVSYNPISDHAKIKNLHMDIWFDKLNLELECIMGCGDMADIINGMVSDMAAPIFNAVMSVVNPILCHALETGINDILKNISISDIIKPDKTTTPAPYQLNNSM